MMNNSLTNLFIFAAGAAVGSLVTWKYLRTKYEQIAQEEIEAVKEVYSERYRHDDEEYLEEDEYTDILSRNGYVEDEITEEKKEVKHMDKPYIISPDEFGEFEDYETVTLYHYADDGVLTDDCDEPVDDVEATVGEDYAEHFGEYEDDSVFVRNDAMKSDFEILLTLGKHNEG